MKQNMPRLFVFALILAFIVSFLPAQAQPAYAVSSSIVISQVYGGGGNAGATYKNDDVELFNRGTTAISLNGWSIQYASSGGTSWSKTNLTNVSLQAGQYYLVQEAAGTGGTVYLPTPDATGNIAMAAGAGKVALVNNTTALAGACPTGSNIIDFVGYGNTTGNIANCSETAPAPTLSNTTADLRNGDGSVDTDNNASDFTVGAPNPRNSLFPFTFTGQATPPSVVAGQTTLLTVTVVPPTNPASTGITVKCNLSLIGGVSSQVLYDDGINGGDVLSGDNIFSFSTVDTVAGSKDVTCTYLDAQARTATTKFAVTLLVVVPIGTVNGPVLNTDDGTTHRSPLAPASGIGAGGIATVQGVIYENTLAATSGGGTNYGFFIQNTSSPTSPSNTADTDPNTSDGLFVYMGYNSTMPGPLGPYTPTVGDEIIVSGSISEYYFMTELSNPTMIESVRSGVTIDAELVPFVANPPVSLADANRFWERRQGMRGQVLANSIVLNGRNVFSPPDAEIWLAAPDSTIALRSDPYTRRAFRDAHILDDNYDPANWDGNGYRILMGSMGIKYTEGDAQALIAPARTFDTVTNSPVGGVNYSFSKYRIEVTTQPVLSEGVDPAANNPPATFDRSVNYSIVDYNMENLYDYRNNPFSGCDFTGDLGCPKVAPFLSPVTPPYDYVPASDAAYQARLNDIADQIVNDLHNPDILMVQEVENQDICTVTLGALDCGLTDNRDGKPDVLQELALKIASLGGP
ncbi:MAG TPA: lamin tail domain-containing protein, partial [Anaerolineaceae bacterium]